MKYTDIHDQLQTGDVLLFSGRGFASLLIRLRTWSWSSHDGMVYRANKRVYVWESTRLTGKDGEQTSLLSERGKTYNGKIRVRRLYTMRDYKFYQTIEDLRAEVKGTKYERNWWELLGAAAIWRNVANLCYLFCSELVALAFKRWKILKNGVPENEYVPGDFEQGGKIDKKLVTGSHLGPAIDIEF